MFCSAHTFLANGRLFVAGGHIEKYVGLRRARAYNPFTNAWEQRAQYERRPLVSNDDCAS